MGYPTECHSNFKVNRDHKKERKELQKKTTEAKLLDMT